MRHGLVTGANGFIGGHLARRLDVDGWRVTRLGRGGGELDVTADLARTDPGAIARSLPRVDVVFHCAGFAHRRGDATRALQDNLEATRRAYELARQLDARRFVFLSTVRVLGEVSRHPFRTGDPRRPVDAYAESKAAAEVHLESVVADTPAVTIVRAPLVYGPGVGANFLALLRATLAGWPLPLGCARAPRSQVAVQNLVDLLVACVGDERGFRLLHARDETDLSVADLVRAIAAAGGRRARLVPVPEAVVRGALRAVGRGALAVRLFEPAQVDDRATRTTLGWTPPCSIEDALAETVTWWQRQRS
jgi:UDP-glucose 4-epimerase